MSDWLVLVDQLSTGETLTQVEAALARSAAGDRDVEIPACIVVLSPNDVEIFPIRGKAREDASPRSAVVAHVQFAHAERVGDADGVYSVQAHVTKTAKLIGQHFEPDIAATASAVTTARVSVTGDRWTGQFW